MNERCTWVIQYSKPSDVPRAHAHMAALGGQVVAVQFSDALDALTKTEAERDALREALKQAAARQGFTNDELISASGLIAKNGEHK